MNPPRITIAIATWNRAALLRQTLGSAESLRVPGGVAWELLVCDNNSTDDTRAVVESFADRLPVRYLFEPAQGKANALNRIVGEASGEWVLFTDDDVRFEPDWIEQYLAGIAEHPEADCFGGPVLPWFERSPGRLTRYFLRVFPWVLSVFRVERDAPMRPVGGWFPYGNNMAVRREVAAAERFDPKRTMMGPVRGAEDTELLLRLLGQGRGGWLLAGPKVHHFIPRQRTGLRWFCKWNAGAGHDRVATRGLAPRRGLWLWRLVAWRLVQAVLRWRPGNPRRSFDCLADACAHVGHVRASEAMRAEQNTDRSRKSDVTRHAQ